MTHKMRRRFDVRDFGMSVTTKKNIIRQKEK